MKSIHINLLFVLLLGISCVKEDQFGLSDRAQIKTFVIPGQSGNTLIDQDSLTIVVPMPENTLDFTLTPSEITHSNFSTVSPSAGKTQDFSAPVTYAVTAENGAVALYEVSVVRSGAQPQLDNVSFEQWYSETTSGNTYDQPGESKETTIWGTANRGLALGAGNPNTTPIPNGDSTAARLETMAAPALVRLAAATLFTGKFTDGFPSINDPRSNIDLGVAFAGRPQSMTFQYTYEPGPSNEDANGQPLGYSDQCDIYLLLEDRSGSQTKRVGTAWFRSSDLVQSWTSINVPIEYGPLDPGHPWYDYAQPQPGEIWGDGSESVTHISVLFTSSFEGDFFKGAVGSTLEVDNFTLKY